MIDERHYCRWKKKVDSSILHAILTYTKMTHAGKENNKIPPKPKNI